MCALQPISDFYPFVLEAAHFSKDQVTSVQYNKPRYITATQQTMIHHYQLFIVTVPLPINDNENSM
jgi:hypothetical protein